MNYHIKYNSEIDFNDKRFKPGDTVYLHSEDTSKKDIQSIKSEKKPSWWRFFKVRAWKKRPIRFIGVTKDYLNRRVCIKQSDEVER